MESKSEFQKFVKEFYTDSAFNIVNLLQTVRIICFQWNSWAESPVQEAICGCFVLCLVFTSHCVDRWRILPVHLVTKSRCLETLLFLRNLFDSSGPRQYIVTVVQLNYTGCRATSRYS